VKKGNGKYYMKIKFTGLFFFLSILSFSLVSFSIQKEDDCENQEEVDASSWLKLL
jgi:hypothetical protein